MSDREGTGRSSRPKTTAKASNDSTLHRPKTRGERLLQWFPELGKNWLREGEPGLESLLAHIQSLRGHVSRRAQETGRDLEARAERLLADVERQAMRGLKPLLNRAQVASHTEMQVLEHRLTHLEGRLGLLLDDRAEVTSRLTELERQQKDLHVDVSERLREIQLRLATDDDTRKELAGVREYLDALFKEQVTRGLDLGKLHDRIVRLEMRFGDLLKEQGAQLADHEEMKQRLATIASELAEAARQARSALDRSDLDRLARGAGDLERTLRQIDLRLGDLAERHAAAGEELIGLTARTRQLELSVAAAPVAGRTEGH